VRGTNRALLLLQLNHAAFLQVLGPAGTAGIPESRHRPQVPLRKGRERIRLSAGPFLSLPGPSGVRGQGGLGEGLYSELSLLGSADGGNLD
jgi:hypothetical protein